ncbi:MAG: histidine phosphatase family protein [Pseudomonadota bacterium]
MVGRIVVARHGRPNLSRDMLISSREYRHWWAQYDLAGVHPDEVPPEALIEIACESDMVVSSTLPRARETAAIVTGGERDVPAEELFVEAPLPPPPLPWLKLRPGVWGVVSRTFWFCGYAPPGVENHMGAWRRAGTAVDRLTGYAADGDILLCAHGYFNWMMDRVLRGRGWRRTHNGGNHYWAWRSYEWPAKKPAPVNPRLAEAAE